MGRTELEIASFLTLLFSSLTDLFLGESGTVVSGLDAPGRAVQVKSPQSTALRPVLLLGNACLTPEEYSVLSAARISVLKSF